VPWLEVDAPGVIIKNSLDAPALCAAVDAAGECRWRRFAKVSQQQERGDKKDGKEEWNLLRFSSQD
jgi:hypothetical protein